MGAKRGHKSLLNQTAEMRELMFAKSREKSKINPVPTIIRLRKREQESELKKWFCSNPHTDCAYYPEVKKFVVMNNTDEDQDTTVYNGDARTGRFPLAPMEMKWFELEEINRLCK